MPCLLLKKGKMMVEFDKELTLEECASALFLSEKTLKCAFNRTKENLKKQEILLRKEGYGSKTVYFISRLPQ